MTISNDELSGLVDWERGLVASRIFIDDEIYRLEIERLFGRAWLFLAHESMIPNPGDFFSTYMGGDPVVVVRQKDGSIKALLNSCRHRGMKVCLAEDGNAKAFMCRYHGWTYDTSGALVTVPNLEDSYYSELERQKWGLVEIRTESYKGLVFGNFDASAPSLVEYLGDMTFYMDGWLDAAPGGLEAVPGVMKWTVKSNWKFPAEQAMGDSYHAPVTHSSMFGPILEYDPDMENQESRAFSSRQGHGQIFFTEHLPGEFSGLADEGLNAYLDKRAADAVARLGRGRPVGGNFTVFPNFSGVAAISPRPLTTAKTNLRVFHPKGPNELEMWLFTLVDKDAPPELKAELASGAVYSDGSAGTIDTDDGENFGAIGLNLHQGHHTRQLMWNYQMGAGHGTTEHERFPGHISDFGFAESPQRGMYRRWLEFMTSDAWPRVESDPRGDELAQAAKTRSDDTRAAASGGVRTS